MPKGLRFLGLLVAEFLAGCVLAVAGYFAVAIAAATQDWSLFGSCKAAPLAGMVLGGPLGCVAGVVLVSVIVRGASGWTGLGTAAALVVALGSVSGVIWLLDAIGGRFFVFAPAVPAAFSMAVYHACLRLRRRRPQDG